MTTVTFYRYIFFAVTLLFFSNVTAKGISFDYAQASYFSDTVGSSGSLSKVEGDGIGFLLSLSFAPPLAMTLAVDATTFRSFQGRSINSSKRTALGVTAHTSVTQATDVFANVSVIKAEIEATDGADSIVKSDLGGVAKIGVRHFITDAIEVELNASYMHVFSVAFTTYAIDARFYVAKRLSLGFGYRENDDQESLLLHLRADL